MSPRFMRHFHIFNLQDTSEETMTHIFMSQITYFLHKKKFNENIVQTMPEITVSATIDLYTQITQNLLPTPSKFQYIFNLRDISKIFQGIMLSKPQTVFEPDTFIKLWVHECSRIFADRLMARADHDYYESLIVEAISQRFKTRWTDRKEDLPDFVFGPGTEIIFSPIPTLEKCGPADPEYRLVIDRKHLHRVLKNRLEDYNYKNPSYKMDLVFFEEAMKYVNKITRVLMQPRSNAMLIGLAGFGK